MKIVLFSPSSGSIIRFRLDLVRRLVELRHDVHIWTAVDDVADVDVLAETGASIRPFCLQRTGINPVNDLRLYRDICKALRDVDPDRVLCYGHKTIVYTSLASIRTRSRVWGMLCGLGYPFARTSPKRLFVRAVILGFYFLLLRRCAGIFFLNHDDLSTLQGYGVVPRTLPCRVIPGEGVPCSVFVAAPLRREKVRFVMIARLLYDKGVVEYIKASLIVRKMFTDAECVLIGPEDSNPSAIPLAVVESYDRSGVINYLGKVEDVRQALIDCSVYVLPSYREGAPRTVLEAMATGRAIITTDAPGCRETVVDAGPADEHGVRKGRNGFLVPVKSVEGLVSAMVRFCSSPELCVCLGAEGRRIAEIKYDTDMVNRHILDFMEVPCPDLRVALDNDVARV